MGRALRTCWSGTQSILGEVAILTGIYNSSHSRALVHGWLLGRPAVLLWKEHRFVFLQKGALQTPVQWLCSQPTLNTSPGQARMSFPRRAAGKWRGPAFCPCLAGRAQRMEKGCLERCVSNHCPPLSCSLSPAMGYCGLLKLLRRCRCEAGPICVFSNCEQFQAEVTKHSPI